MPKLGKALTDEAELLYRQATSPAWVVDGRPTSQLFELRPLDQGQLSVERASVAGSPEDSLAGFSAKFRPSVSVWGVSVGEVHGLKLEVYEQPSNKLPAHAAIDLSSCTEDEQRAKAVLLTRAAAEHGQLAPKVPTGKTAGNAKMTAGRRTVTSGKPSKRVARVG